jgi:multicomponent Na+:H+ antiporter subunit B
MIGEYPGQVVRTMCVLIAPLIMIFGIYVIAHGHYGPGGGFAGGIVVGVGIILLRVTVSSELVSRWFPPTAGPVAASAGVLIYIGVGAASALAGGSFLDYSAIDLDGMSAADQRYYGIFVVEVAVGIAVSGVMLTLFDALAGVPRVETSDRQGDTP